jgi:hypothetical protein
MAKNKDFFSARNSTIKNQACMGVVNDRSNTCLSMDTAYKMINQFLSEKKMSKQDLATALGVSLEVFEEYHSGCASKQLMSSVGYRLLSLYCKTRWNYKLLPIK